MPGVKEIMTSQWFNGVYKDARDPKNFFARFGVDPPENLFTIFSELKIPEDQKQAFLHDRTGTVIGRDLANKFGFHVGDRITIIGDIYPGNLELNVRGIFDSPRKSEMLYFHWAYVREGLAEARKGEVGTFDILCEDAAVVPRVAKAVDDEFHNSPVQTRTETEQAFLLSFVSMLGNVKLFLISICAAVMFTILLVSGNTMAMSVRERVREVGVLEDVGFHRRQYPFHHSGRSRGHLHRRRRDRVPALHLPGRRSAKQSGRHVPAAHTALRSRRRLGLHWGRSRHRTAQFLHSRL